LCKDDEEALTVTSNVQTAFQTLFILITLDQWEALVLEMQQIVSPVTCLVYVISWVWLGAFIFRNIIVGVMGK
jgi:cation channel sperm-associated protein 2